MHVTSPDGGPDLVAVARAAVSDASRLPLPGSGATVRRWQGLADVAAHDLSLARLVEGHVDALAILAELGGPRPDDGDLLGVWAARPEQLIATRSGGGWVLEGDKPFCSGSTGLDAALVTATTPDGVRLFLVPGAAGRPDPSSWQPLGMAATRSETLDFAGVEVTDAAAVGGLGAYVDRPGFGHGGCGVAACWWGGATALLGDVRDALRGRAGPLQIAGFATVALAVDGAARALRSAAAEVDAAPHDVEVALRCAATTRLVTALACRDVLALAAAHLGTSVLATRPDVAGRLADLTTYLTQFRDESAVDLGARLLDEAPERLC
jgi:alkylation response protein AidB-like acyl-CoA dehydrogenase